MKRKIAIFIVLTMLFALAGCGQQTSKTKTQESASTEEQLEQTAAQEGPAQDEQNDTEDLLGYDFDTDDGIDNSSSNTSVSGTKNADGTYTHNVDGYELVLKTNLADYIHDDVFYYAELAKDLGWFIKENLRAKYEDDPNWPAYYWGDNNEYMVTFNDPTSMSCMQLYYECPYNHGRNIIFKRYDKDDSNSITYQINPGGSYDANYEQIVILTFQFENIPLSPDSDPLEYINQTQTGTWVVYK